MTKWSKISALLLLLVLATCGVAVGQTNTPTATSTATRTVTNTATRTHTKTATATRTATRTKTTTVTKTVTQTRTPTNTGGPTGTVTKTPAVTPTPTRLVFSLILNDPLTDPPNLVWAAELVRRLRLYSFCDTGTCGGEEPLATHTPISTVTQTGTVTVTPTFTITHTPTHTNTPYSAWSIIDAPSGTDPVADVPGDTFVLTSSNCTITGNSGTDTIDFNCPGAGAASNSFETWDTPSGTDIVADSSTDTAQFLATGIVTITGGGAADTITFGAVEVDGSVTNEIQNIFETFNAPAGTDPVADTATDTINLTATGICSITGNSGTDTLDWTCTEVDGSVSNEINTFTATSGGTTTGLAVTLTGAGITTTSRSGDTVTFTSTEVDGSVTNEINTFTADSGGATTGLGVTLAGAGIVVTSRSGNTVTFTGTEVDGSTTNELQNLFATFNAPAGTDPVADTTTDTLNITSSNCTITGDSATDTLDFNCPGSGGSTNSFETWDTSSGTDPVADSGTDTIILTGTSPVVVTGSSAADSVTYSWDFSVANTWTGLQTFDAGADWNDNDSARFGTGDDATILYNGTDLKINPGPFQKTSFANRIELADGGGTYVTNASFIDIGDTITIDAVIAYSALAGSQSIILEQDPSAFIEGSFVLHGNTYTNPSGEIRTFGPTFLMADTGTWNPNTTTGASTKSIWYTVFSYPTFTKTGANTATLATFTSFFSGVTLANGAAITERIGYEVVDVAGTGTVGAQVGFRMGSLVFAADDWSLQIGSAKSYHLGPIVFGAAAAPCTSCGIELESTTSAVLLSRMDTAARNALTAEDGMLIYNTSTLVTERRENGAWVSGGGASGNSVEVSIVLGGAGYYSTTVTGQAWVAVGSEITCSPFGTTADSLTPEAIAVAELTSSASDRVIGTGFNLQVYNPHGLTGTARFHCVGV